MSPPCDVVTCVRCEERLEAWLDGELDPVEAVAIEHHVRRCRSCAESASLAREILRDLRDLPELDPAAAVLEGVRATAGRRVRSIPRSRHPALLAAAAALVIGLSAVLMSRPARPTETDRIEQAAIEVRYALGVVARAGRSAGRELGNSLNDGLPARRAAAEIGRVLDRARPSDPEVLDVHGG